MRKAIALFAFLALIAIPLLGQARTGNIYGKVVDAASGQPLPGVAITLTGQGIAPMTAITTAEGNFRFLRLPPGVYSIKAELQGFKTLERKDIRVLVGSNVTLTLKLEEGTIKEEVTVTAAAPVVDTKKATVASNVTKEALQELPTARDPWVILDLTPGVMVDRVNVGGSESGQQSNFYARGDSGDNAQWNIDGVTITDAAAIGASPTYYDYDSFEEMNISTAANDVTAPTGGVIINFVTRRGGNKISGGGRFYYTGEKFEANIPEDVKADLINPDYKGNRLKHIYDYGFNIGGPIVKDKLWFWGSYGVQDIANTDVTGELPDNTMLKGINAKINAQLGHHRIEFFFSWNDKVKEGRGASAYRPHETTWHQTGPSPIYKLQDDFTIGQNFFGSLKLGHVAGGFKLEPYGGRDTYVILDYAGVYGIPGAWHNTFYWYETTRPQYQATFVGNYFLEGFLGATHEIKFGAEYRYTPVTSMSNFGNGMVLFLYDPSWVAPGFGEVWFVRQNKGNLYTARASAYIQDSISSGKLTLNLGLRYDRQWAKNLADSVPANQYTQTAYEEGYTSVNWLPEGSQEDYRLPFTWNFFSPRISALYDLSGDGKTVLKASFSLYGSQLGVGLNYGLSPIQWREVDFFWYDANGDGEYQPNEVFWSWGPIWYDHEPGEPNKVVNKVGDDYRDPKTLEVTFGIQHELITDLAVSLNLYYRKMYDFNWGYREGITREDWYIAGYIPQEYGGYAYWACSKPKPAGVVYQYHPDYWQDYKGIELIVNKRLSNRWMLNGSFTYQLWRQHFDSPAAYIDPTNHEPVDLLNNRDMAYESRGSGLGNIYPNAKWMFKFGGLYQLPYGFNISATFIARQGYIAPVHYVTYRPSNGWGSTVGVYIKPFGDERLPNFYILNARLEKVFDLQKFGKIYLSVDGFNLTNNAVALAKEFNAARPTFGKITQVTNPRVFRFGIRYEF